MLGLTRQRPLYPPRCTKRLHERAWHARIGLDPKQRERERSTYIHIYIYDVCMYTYIFMYQVAVEGIRLKPCWSL